MYKVSDYKVWFDEQLMIDLKKELTFRNKRSFEYIYRISQLMFNVKKKKRKRKRSCTIVNTTTTETATMLHRKDG